MDSINPLGYMCPRFQKKCELISDCAFRMHNGECMERTEYIRRLGTMKRIQNTMLALGHLLQNEGDWRDFGIDLQKIWKHTDGNSKAQSAAENLYP